MKEVQHCVHNLPAPQEVGEPGNGGMKNGEWGNEELGNEEWGDGITGTENAEWGNGSMKNVFLTCRPVC